MESLLDNLDAVLEGFLNTIQLTLVSAVLSLVLGTILTAMRVSPTPIFRAAGTAYVNLVRNTPLTLILVFCSLGLSDTLQIRFSEEPAINGYWLAVMGLSAYTAAFVCEALRSGVNTVPLGQAEAARAIGLTFFQSLRLVVLPQAFRAVIAPLGSVLIALTKNTTVAAAAGYAESAFVMKDLIDDGHHPVPLFIGLAIGFMLLTLPTGFVTGWLARRMAVAR